MNTPIKFVRYNGKCENSYGSSPPNRLILGKVYPVTRVQDFGRHSEYELDGVLGVYNENWFDEVYDVSLAVSSIIPTKDSVLTCHIITSKNDEYSLEEKKFSVSEVWLFEIDTYRVVDNQGNHYIVKLL